MWGTKFTLRSSEARWCNTAMQRSPETVLSRKGTAIKSHLRLTQKFLLEASSLQCPPDSLMAPLPDNCQQVVTVVGPHLKPCLGFLAFSQVLAVSTTQVKQDASILNNIGHY